MTFYRVIKLGEGNQARYRINKPRFLNCAPTRGIHPPCIPLPQIHHPSYRSAVVSPDFSREPYLKVTFCGINIVVRATYTEPQKVTL